jgi:class 3 adenylate cyclase
MQPDVRYCTTTDGVRIAYTVTGDGPPMVSLIDGIVSHVALEWSHPINKQVLEAEARLFRLVRLDSRGTGLSERIPPAGLEGTVLDVEAVVDRLTLDRFTLHANTSAAQAAILFAARHPDRVSRLVLIDGFIRSADLYATPPVAAFLAAAASDWETATEALGALAFGPGRQELHMHGEYVRACISPDFFTNLGAFASIDVSAEASSLRMPVLVVRHTGVRWLTDQMTHDLVSRIPDARLVTINGTWADDVDGLVQRIAAFVYEGEDAPRIAPPQQHMASGVRTVLFTDVVDHTAMMRRLGDTQGRAVLRELERMTRDAIKRHDGVEIKTDGDSFMVSFGCVASGVECAVHLQRTIAQHNAGAEEPLRVRMGLNAGEPIEDDGDLFGESVILASRIAAEAGEGEILIAEPVRHLLAGKGFTFADRGTFVPKGFDDAVRLFEVVWRES